MPAKETPAKVELTDEKKEELKAYGKEIVKRAAFAAGVTIAAAIVVNSLQNRKSRTDEDDQS